MTSKNKFKNPEPDKQSIDPVKLEQLLNLQNKILGATVTSENYKNLLDQLCLLAEELTPESVASIMLYDKQKKQLFVHAAPSIPSKVINDLDGLTSGDGSCGNCVFHNEDMFVCNTLTDNRWENIRDLAENYKIHACWSSPIRNTAEDAIGSFALSSFEKRTPDNFQRLLLNSCSSIAGIIIHRENLLKESRTDRSRLINSQQQYRSLVDNSADGIFLHDDLGNLHDVNQMACDSLGYSRSELLSMTILDIDKSIPDMESFRHVMGELTINETCTLDGIHQSKDGQQFPVEIRLRKFISNNEALIIALVRDVSIRKKHDEEISRENKLNSIGLLAGGIAHDFNNLLGGIQGYIELAEYHIQSPKKIEQYLKKATSATIQAADLTQQLLTFSKGGEPIKKAANIFDIINQSTDFILHGSDININYFCNCEDSLWIANVDSGQISQVIQNLVINARQAMPEGGDLDISCENCIISESKNGAHLLHNKHIKIIIKDNGFGMSKEIMESIFDPYFTTKQQGNGLGLALSYSIINKHNGNITVDSTPGHGTTFTLLLPVSDETIPVSIPVISKTNHHRTSALIMIMDNDPMLLEVSRDMLHNLGHKTVEVTDGGSALSKYKDLMNTNNRVDLVIMDLTIPNGIGGKEAIKLIRKFDPDVKALVSSGYCHDPVMANYADYGFIGALKKPYNQDELETTVDTILMETKSNKTLSK